MKGIDIKKLCIQLAKADSEKEVIYFLKGAGFWDNPDVWEFYGGFENNYSIIGNQQSTPDSAMVEKIVNSVDAVLTRECLLRNIKPESLEAPQSIKEALIDFFDIADGNLANISKLRRKELAQNILVVATGKKSQPCFSFIDKGEGQIPEMIPDTFLSLVKTNKVKIPFVQGRYNMGSTGVLPFCGRNHLQLIISKRNPKLIKNILEESEWGFTIVRKFEPTGNMKNSVFKYLAPDRNILKFKSKSLPLLPGDYPKAYEKPLEWGTFIKLYDYQLPGGLKSAITLDLYYKLSSLLPSIALPATLYERRKGYVAHEYHTYLNGLSVRLEENKYEDLEENFPSSVEINLNKQKFIIRIFAFKKTKAGRTKNRYSKEAVIFTHNGQAQGFLPKSFLERKSVKMDYLSDSILILVDCSHINQQMYEKLFMSSRDRLYDRQIRKQLEKRLEQIISNHAGLKELREARRREEIKEKIADNKQLQDIINKVIQTSPNLTKIFITGEKITDPFNLEGAGRKKKFQGKKYPTFFRLVKNYPQSSPKNCMVKHGFRIQFETDACNDYFSRDDYPGKFELELLGDFSEKNFEYQYSLWEGKLNLHVRFDKTTKINEIYPFKVTISDIKHITPFTEEFYVRIIKETKTTSGPSKPTEEPPGDEDQTKRKKPSRLNLPEIIEISKDEWEKYDFNKYSALRVKYADEKGYDFFINIDNIYLNTELKTTKIEQSILKEQYKAGMVLIALSLIHDYEEKEETKKKENIEEIEGEEISILEIIYDVTKAVSPFLIPMITVLGDIERK